MPADASVAFASVVLRATDKNPSVKKNTRVRIKTDLTHGLKIDKTRPAKNPRLRKDGTK